MHEVNKKSVYVGVSGGVDSSVSAYLLKQATPNNFEKLFGRPTPKGFSGYDVTGVFIRVWYPDFLECNWKNERRDAMKVCAELGIPFKELDLEDVYKKEVADYMISEYKAGRTPNPDVMCNKYVKFGGFFDWAINEGADYVATGHYARISSGDEIREARNPNHEIRNSSVLQAGLDKNKDQSYFLWTLTQKQLSKTLFPIGDLEKSEVRKIAKKAGLLTAEKKDSQGVCFLGEISMKEFLKKLAKPEPGKVIGEGGEEIGHHDGSIIYTIGERRGFTITKKTPNDKPYFIVSKDLEKNTITVSDKLDAESPAFNGKELKLGKVNWISGEPEEGKKYHARIRYRQELQECLIVFSRQSAFNSASVRVRFSETQKAVAVGQSVVVYDGEVCLGGGIIQSIKLSLSLAG